MYKLIALDMDGTLLNSEKVISEENKQAIAKAREAGVTVVLASGRPLEGMQDKLDELNIDSDKDFVLYYKRLNGEEYWYERNHPPANHRWQSGEEDRS